MEATPSAKDVSVMGDVQYPPAEPVDTGTAHAPDDQTENQNLTRETSDATQAAEAVTPQMPTEAQADPSHEAETAGGEPAVTESGDLPAPELHFALGASSETGGRPINEDFFLLDRDVLCISDGIGGAAYGEVLSKMCCHAFRDAWFELTDSGLSAQDRMLASLRSADMFSSKVSSYLNEGSGATLVAAALVQDAMVFGAVGDSAALIVHNGVLGNVFEDDGRQQGCGNMLDGALGYGELEKRPQCIRIVTVQPQEGMRICLCSDGVWDQLDTSDLSRILQRAEEPYHAAFQLTRTASSSLGPRSDNATAAIAFVSSQASSPASTPTLQYMELQQTPFASCLSRTCQPTDAK